VIRRLRRPTGRTGELENSVMAQSAANHIVNPTREIFDRAAYMLCGRLSGREAAST
jgi:hypothetical protein